MVGRSLSDHFCNRLMTMILSLYAEWPTCSNASIGAPLSARTKQLLLERYWRTWTTNMRPFDIMPREFFYARLPAGRLGYLSPDAKELLLLWKPHARTLEQYLDRDDPRAGVFIAASILRLDNQHAGALAYVRREMETLKDEYENHAFALSSSFPLLGDDAKRLVPIAIRHAKYEGAWAVPGQCGRADLEDMGTIAVPFIVQEISNSESSLQNKDFTLEGEGWYRGNVLRFLSQLEIMAANAKFTGTDLSSATPLVKRLTESADQEIKKAAESTLARMAQDQNGEAENP